MAPDETAEDRALLEEVRRRRSELRDAMAALELALAGPAPAGHTTPWLTRVHDALVDLAGDLGHHVALTEGPNGLYQDLLRTAPRLSGPVDNLTREHAEINQRLEAVLALASTPGATADVEEIRVLGTSLLGRIVRHRQRGADLVYEAYEVDVGGGE